MSGDAWNWPLAVLACGHIASVQEAMRTHDPERFCMYCARWVPVEREFKHGVDGDSPR